MLDLWRNFSIISYLALFAQAAPTYTNHGRGVTPGIPGVVTATAAPTPSAISPSKPPSMAITNGNDDKTEALVQALASLGGTLDEIKMPTLKSNCDPSMTTKKATPQTLKQCRPFAKAAPAILAGFKTNKLQSTAEKAGSVAWMVFESGSFSYSLPAHISPGDAGKGTQCMQAGRYNIKYAQSIKEFGHVDGNDPGGVVKKLVANDEWSFGAASWFIHTYGKGILAKNNASEKEFRQFLTDIIALGGRLDARVKIFNKLFDEFKKRGI